MQSCACCIKFLYAHKRGFVLIQYRIECLNDDAKNRPTMKAVRLALENKTVIASKSAAKASSAALARSSMPPLDAGDEVVRGPDWRWSDQDGGAGTVGEVIEELPGLPSRLSSVTGWVAVKWPSGRLNRYGCI